MTCIVREPLAQFFMLALLLFGANHLIRGSESSQSGEIITISRGRVQQVADSYRLLAGRPPDRSELQALVHDFVDEEIAYREAVAMGLDADDTIVRRRMRQKLEFLAEDAEPIEEPTDAQLIALLSQGARDYRLPERISFRQVLLNHDTQGPRAYAQAQVMLEKLLSGADPTQVGDASMLPSVVAPTSQQGVALLFGDTFAAALFAHRGEHWFGPLTSPLGAHVVRVLAREPARDPAFEEIRHRLRNDWIETRRKTTRESFLAGLRDRYEISIEWPEQYVRSNSAQLRANRHQDSIAVVGD